MNSSAFSWGDSSVVLQPLGNGGPADEIGVPAGSLRRGCP